MFRQKQNYKTRLHLLLQANPDGLPIAEIADLLQLNDTKCKYLIAEEEARGTVDVKIADSEIPLYFSKRKVMISQDSIDRYALPNTKFLVIGCVAILLGLFVLSGWLYEFKYPQDSLTSTYMDLPSSVQHKESNKKSLNYRSQQHDINLSEYVEGKIAKKKISEYETKRIDLEKRVELMEEQKYSCYKDWFTNQPCYITNRLLNKEQFERELAEMKLEISKLSELISFYKK